VPAYLVESDDPRVLQDIFDRMNNFGRRLSRAEIFSALNAPKEFDPAGGLSLDGISAAIDEATAFGPMDADTVLAAVLARRGPDVRRDIRREFTRDDDETLEEAYRAGHEAIELAVRFLQSDATVPHYSLLAYKYLLVVLTRFFAHFPDPDKRNRALLRRWYWQAAVGGPEVFRGGTPNAARILCGKIVPEDASGSVQRLLSAVEGARRDFPQEMQFSTSDAKSKIVLCAMWSRGPRDPVSISPFSAQDLSAQIIDSKTAQPVVHNLIPQTSVPEWQKRWVANRLIMPGDAPSGGYAAMFTAEQPLTINDEDWRSLLESHFLYPALVDLLSGHDFEQFLQLRQEDIDSYTSEFLSRACEWHMENTPPLSAFDLDEDE
jgi:hypothetical protein